jgi:hypothetical protein
VDAQREASRGIDPLTEQATQCVVQIGPPGIEAAPQSRLLTQAVIAVPGFGSWPGQRDDGLVAQGLRAFMFSVSSVAQQLFATSAPQLSCEAQMFCPERGDSADCASQYRLRLWLIRVVELFREG